MGFGDFVKGMFKTVQQDVLQEDPILAQAVKESAGITYWYQLKVSDLPVFKEKVLPLSDRDKIDFILQQVKSAHEWRTIQRASYSNDAAQKAHLCQSFVEQLMRTKLNLLDGDFAILIDSFIAHKRHAYNHVMGWPVKSLTGLAQKKYQQGGVPEDVKQAFIVLKNELATEKNVYYDKQCLKLIEQIDTLLFTGTQAQNIKPVYFLGVDEFAAYANGTISAQPEDKKQHWYRLMSLCQKSSGSAPSKKILADGLALINQISVDDFARVISDWFSFITKMKEKRVENNYYLQYEFITAVNVDCLKGFVWLSTTINTPGLLTAIAAMADRAYRKLPGVGQTCTALGNAAVYTLSKAEGLEGVNQLSRLKLKVKQPSTQVLIDKYLTGIAAAKGVTTDVIEDLAVDDYGITDGKLEVPFNDDYCAVITIEKVGRVNTAWYKKDGTQQKSDPASIKESQPEELKDLKTTAKQIEAALSTQRDRLDLSLRAGRKMDWTHFLACYHNNGLVAFISRKLIWRFTLEGNTFDAMYLDGQWTNPSGQVFQPDETFTVTLWHPAVNPVDSVQQWRNYLIAQQIQQPLKQAFREIYLLTDAEINTRSYSNRMAGHILKQHQFNSLAKARGWRYHLQGAFDGGSEGTAMLTLPEHQLTAEYWTNSIDGGHNETGIFTYVSTDQVRFKNSQTRATVDLIDIPVIALSEVMRDVDLFVGVASVGNDPNWRDNGGLPAYHDYWQSYAFGDLNEISKTRKQMMERLLPRLKIAPVAEIRDKFLVVKGKLRTYKIHLGSTNILMEPNDQYLCIVPARGERDLTGNVFLPFEGDNGLSIIISKAFLLADDDKITDPTITRQIKRDG